MTSATAFPSRWLRSGGTGASTARGRWSGDMARGDELRHGGCRLPSLAEQGCASVDRLSKCWPGLEQERDMSASFAPVPQRERVRIEHFMAMLPDDLGDVLEIGTRDGRVTGFLVPRARSITALDLTPPSVDHPKVHPLVGNLVALPFRDRAFDTVICTEVLEHIPVPGLHHAVAELARVVRGRLLVGVPFDQDTRLGSMRCPHCGVVNPPWGHVNRFDQQDLLGLFPDLEVQSVEPCGQSVACQSEVSALLEAWLDYPNGIWNQEEPCVACGRDLERPTFSRRKRLAAAVPRVLNKVSRALASPRPAWIHVVFTPPGGAGQDQATS